MPTPLEQFEQFYRAQYPRLAGSLRLVCGDESLAEEFAQEAFTRALNHWDRLKDYDQPAGWLYRTGFNLVRRHWTKTKRSDEAVLDFEPAAAEGAEPERIDLVAALARLPIAQREVVVLRHILDYSTEEVAATLDAAPGAVRMTLHRALANLRKQSGITLDDTDTTDATDKTERTN